jgi:putative transposase
LQQARRLKKIIDTVKISKPQLKDLQPELDQRFIKVGLDNNTLFDGWIKLTCIGRGIILHIPFKRTTHFNEMMIKGKLKPGIRISNKAITFNFEITNPVERTDGKIVGLDIGIKNIFTTSDGQISQNDSHGWNLDKIQQKLSRRKKGSKEFRKAQEHRKNHTNWSINRLNLNGVKTLRFEKIINLRRGYRSSRYLSHWTYAAIFGKLVSVCSKHGVRVERVDPAYTSQRCSQCDWVRKSNRKGNRFRCTACGFISDADRNASCNIALELPRKRRSQHSNRTGFYWNVASQEPIVPDARKVN